MKQPDARTLLVGIRNNPATLESVLEVSYKVRYVLITWSSKPAPRHFPREIKMHVHTKSCMQILRLGTQAWKHPKYPSAGEWIDYATCPCNGLSDNEEGTATRAMILRISSTEWREATCCVIPLIRQPGNGETVERQITDGRWPEAGGGGGRTTRTQGTVWGGDWNVQCLDQCLLKFTTEQG